LKLAFDIDFTLPIFPAGPISSCTDIASPCSSTVVFGMAMDAVDQAARPQISLFGMKRSTGTWHATVKIYANSNEQIGRPSSSGNAN
jgi:hypothetical protein